MKVSFEVNRKEFKQIFTVLSAFIVSVVGVITTALRPVLEKAIEQGILENPQTAPDLGEPFEEISDESLETPEICGFDENGNFSREKYLKDVIDSSRNFSELFAITGRKQLAEKILKQVDELQKWLNEMTGQTESTETAKNIVDLANASVGKNSTFSVVPNNNNA